MSVLKTGGRNHLEAGHRQLSHNLVQGECVLEINFDPQRDVKI